MKTPKIRQTSEHTERIASIGEKINNVTTDAIQTAILSARSQNLADAIYIGSVGINGALLPVAQLVANKPDPTSLGLPSNPNDLTEADHAICREVASKLVNPDTMLFAAILAARICGGISSNNMVAIEFGPHIVLEALEIFEKATGRNPDKLLDPRMVAEARKVGENTTIPLEEFMEKRRGASPSSETLQ